MEWYIHVLKNYAVFTGRARRKEYWMFFLFNILASFVLGILIGVLGGILHLSQSTGLVLSQVYGLAVFIPSIAVAIRRMHDSGHSGWWILCPFYNLYLLCINGQAGSNVYGDNPKGE